MNGPGVARKARAGARGSALTTAFAVVAVILGCALVGFYIGRNILGQQYVKLGAARVRPQPWLPLAPGSPEEPPLVEQPQSVIEPAEEPTAPPRSPRSVKAPAKRSVAPPTGPNTVTLQLGSYLKPENAEAMVRDLRNRGYSPTVVVEKQGPSTVHKVQMPRLSPEQARSLASDLKREGYQVGVVEGK